MTPDTRETLDPAWETLSRARLGLVWNIRYSEYVGQDLTPHCRALGAWDGIHAEEWNRLKPWYEARLTSWKDGHAESIRARFEEKQLP